MRKVYEIKEEIQSVIDNLSRLAKELHVSEYADFGEDNTPLHVVMGRKLAIALFGYISSHESLSTEEAYEVADCINQALRGEASVVEEAKEAEVLEEIRSEDPEAPIISDEPEPFPPGTDISEL
jgi:hypothetical protein